MNPVCIIDKEQRVKILASPGQNIIKFASNYDGSSLIRQHGNGRRAGCDIHMMAKLQHLPVVWGSVHVGRNKLV